MSFARSNALERSQVFHLALELGPGLGFFVAYEFAGIGNATGTLIALTAASLVLGWSLARRLPVLPAISCGLVILLGGALLIQADETFIKMRPTIGQLLFATFIAGSVLLGRPIPERALGPMLSLTRRGWVVLSWRWVVIAIALAAVNEAAWRLLSTDDWVTVKLVMGSGGLLIYYTVTRVTARRHWQSRDV
jgi:intracellular septation protein